MARINQRLNGLEPLNYMGANAVQPPDFVTKMGAPTVNDSKNFALGDIWLDMSGYPNTLPTANDIYMLVALVGNQATWVSFGGGDVETLTSNSGGPVGSDANSNINVIGDNLTMVGVGNPGTNTITFSTKDDGSVSSLTGDSGGPVFPTGWNIDTLGTAGKITVTGNPGTSTLTWDLDGSVAQEFATDNGSAVPAAGVITFDAISQAGQTISFSGSGSTVRLNTTDADSNLALGEGSGAALNGGSENTFIGRSAGSLLVGGDRNIAIGFAAGSQISVLGESGNTLIGNPGISGISGLVAIDFDYGGPRRTIMHNYPAGGSANGTNLFLGEDAGNFTMNPASQSNYSLGGSTLSSLVFANHNIAIGNVSLAAVTTGGNNVAVGHSCGFDPGGPAGITTGQSNILIGYTAGTGFTSSESYNIIIGEGNGRAPAGVSRVGSIGFTDTANDLLKMFIAGIRGVTTDVNNAIPVLIDSAGQLGTTSSSRVYKENIKDMGDASAPIMKLRPVTFNYKKHEAHDIQYGLIAEEVAEIMPELVVNDANGKIYSVKYQDLVPLLLNEVQKLSKEVAELKAKLT